MHRLRQGASPSGADRADDLGGVRGGAAEARSLCRQVRWIPRGAGIRLEDLLGALRQQQVLGGGQCGPFLWSRRRNVARILASGTCHVEIGLVGWAERTSQDPSRIPARETTRV